MGTRQKQALDALTVNFVELNGDQLALTLRSFDVFETTDRALAAIQAAGSK